MAEVISTLKRLRESLPLIGQPYRKVRRLREQMQELNAANAALTESLNSVVQQRDNLVAQQARLLEQVSPRDALFFENAQTESTHRRFIEFLKLIRPLDIAGLPKARVGAWHDGGYVMIDDFAQSTNAISIGIGTEISWDRDLACRGIRVVQVEEAGGSPCASEPRFTFMNKRVVKTARCEHEITLTQLLNLPEVCGDNELLMKIDIEGDEWEVLEEVCEADLKRIRQLVIEFHWLQNFARLDWADRALTVLRKLAHAHQVVHVHGNNSAGFAVLGGIAFPNVFELTLVRRDEHCFADSGPQWPTALDAPNKPSTTDLYIGAIW